jgi:septum formation protein
MPELILASRSPQRRAILTQLGIPFTAVPVDVEELAAGDPAEVARENARRKAAAAPGDLVLGVDTVVALDGGIHGKPVDEAGARAVLELLAGRTHEVWSGVAVAEGGGEPRSAVAVTKVTFRPHDPALLDWYVASGEWRERAGGYAIQGRGAVLVERIDGDFHNVVGLPVQELLQLLPGILHRRS